MKSTQLLVPDLPGAATDTDLWQHTLDPTTRSLREAGQNVTATLEPVTKSAQRAITLFWRDISAAGPEVKN
jgi:hypothetical protein